MLSNIFILLRQELILSLLIFLLLFIKIGKERSNETVLNLINILLFVNLAAGLFGMSEGGAFNGMFTTNAFIVLEKNILNLAILLISMQSYAWLKHHKQVAELHLILDARGC